jgi:hypothetical protein
LLVFDITGRQVAKIVDQFQAPGTYETDFNASALASGVYFYRLNIGDKFTDVKKMVLLK